MACFRRNMRSRKTKVAIVGTGTAGLNARRKVAIHTDDYLVMDGGELGTSCAREGCMPSKDLLHEAHRAFQGRKFFEDNKLDFSKDILIATPGILRNIRRRRNRFVDTVLESMQEWTCKHFIAKNAEFIDPQTLDLGDEQIEAEHIILATGSRPVIPNEWTPYHSFLMTSDSVFELKQLPQRIAVIGLGAVGLELAQALARLGVEVHAFQVDEGIGGLEDSQAQHLAEQIFSREFAIHNHRARPLRSSGHSLRLSTAHDEIEVDKVLIAVGRKPHVVGLGLARLGKPLDENGLPALGEGGLHVKGSNVYIIGDANDERPVLHEARFDAECAVDMIFRKEDRMCPRPPRLSILFTDPQICLVGTPVELLTKRSQNYVPLSVSLEKSGRSLIENDGDGIIQMYFDKQSGCILGAELLCRGAEHLGHLLALSIQRSITAEQLLDMPFYHPTVEEALRNILSRFVRQYPQQQKDHVSSLDMPQSLVTP
jgi:dihydrolipoamide dehydrogenase